jgi:hypothetical protein
MNTPTTAGSTIGRNTRQEKPLRNRMTLATLLNTWNTAVRPSASVKGMNQPAMGITSMLDPKPPTVPTTSASSNSSANHSGSTWTRYRTTWSSTIFVNPP